jgi:hypothetical protein
MEQRALTNVNNCSNTNMYSYLEISDGKSCSLYLNVVHFFSTIANYTSVALKTIAFLHWCLSNTSSKYC